MGLCPGMPHISIWPQLGSVWDDSTLETVRDLKIWRTLMMFGEVNSKLSSKYLFRWPGHFSLTTWTSNTSPEIVQLGQLYMLRISISCFFLIWLLNLLLNSGRLSDITGWCPKSLAKLVQMSLITRDYEIIFIVNPTNTTGGTTLHQLMVFQFFSPLCFHTISMAACAQEVRIDATTMVPTDLYWSISKRDPIIQFWCFRCWFYYTSCQKRWG